MYLMKTLMVETMYYCNLLCYVKCSTSLLTFKVIAVSLYHMIKGGSCVHVENFCVARFLHAGTIRETTLAND